MLALILVCLLRNTSFLAVAPIPLSVFLAGFVHTKAWLIIFGVHYVVFFIKADSQAPNISLDFMHS